MAVAKLLVAVVGDNVALAECARHHSTMFITGQTLTVFAGGRAIHYDGAMNTLHNHGSLCVNLHSQPLVASAQKVRVEGIAIARNLDPFKLCTGVVKAYSQTTVFVGAE